jgi:hypothetical protein
LPKPRSRGQRRPKNRPFIAQLPGAAETEKFRRHSAEKAKAWAARLVVVDTKTILSADALRIFHELKSLAQEADRTENAMIEALGRRQ